MPSFHLFETWIQLLLQCSPYFIMSYMGLTDPKYELGRSPWAPCRQVNFTLKSILALAGGQSCALRGGVMWGTYLHVERALAISSVCHKCRLCTSFSAPEMISEILLNVNVRKGRVSAWLPSSSKVVYVPPVRFLSREPWWTSPGRPGYAAQGAPGFEL